jgi:hypothetical protein
MVNVLEGAAGSITMPWTVLSTVPDEESIKDSVTPLWLGQPETFHDPYQYPAAYWSDTTGTFD